MKSREIPTSPKNRMQVNDVDELYKMEPTIIQPKHHMSLYVIFSVFISVFITVAVCIGAKILADRYPNVRVLKYFRTNSQTQERVVVRQEVVSRDIPVPDLLAKIASTTGTLMKERVQGAQSPDDRTGLVTFLTNDGIAVSVTNAVLSQSPMVIRTSDMNDLPITEMQLDPTTGITFLQTAATTETVPFLNNDQVSVGMSVFVTRTNTPNGGQNAVMTTVTGLRERPVTGTANETLVDSSETLPRRLRLGQNLDPTWNGAAVFDTQGKLIGIVTGNDGTAGSLVVSISSIKNVIQKFSTTKKIVRPVLGVRYIDLSYVPVSGLPSKGAYLTTGDQKKFPAVLPKSPAADAGLTSGDVISSIDSVPLNELTSLVDAISRYDPLNKIVLSVTRNGKESKITVTLGTSALKK